jgi:hypothetical protein
MLIIPYKIIFSRAVSAFFFFSIFLLISCKTNNDQVEEGGLKKKVEAECLDVIIEKTESPVAGGKYTVMVTPICDSSIVIEHVLFQFKGFQRDFVKRNGKYEFSMHAIASGKRSKTNPGLWEAQHEVVILYQNKNSSKVKKFKKTVHYKVSRTTVRLINPSPPVLKYQEKNIINFETNFSRKTFRSKGKCRRSQSDI